MPGPVPLPIKKRLRLRPRKPRARKNTADTTLSRAGALEVKLAVTATERRRAQRLRYEVFYKEGSANASALGKLLKRDADKFDKICDHALVLDHSAVEHKAFRKDRPKVVGTYRFLRQDVAEAHGRFYTADEFDIAPLLKRYPHLRFMELGRSCVLKSYRTKRPLELLWQAIWNYFQQHQMDVMFGCASFEGTDVEALTIPLSYLYHFHRAPPAWDALPLQKNAARFTPLPREDINPATALLKLPPLIKGYLRAGALIGSGAVIDRQFNTVDVFIILPRDHIAPRYLKHFGREA